jgi:hypothetical protein
MNKLPAQPNSSGDLVIAIPDLLKYLSSLRQIAYWRSGEQILQMIEMEVNSAKVPSAPAPTTA